MVPPPTKISESTGRVTINCLPDVKLGEEARNQKMYWPKFCSIIDIDVRDWSWKFQIEISKVGYFTEQSVT